MPNDSVLKQKQIITLFHKYFQINDKGKISNKEKSK